MTDVCLRCGRVLSDLIHNNPNDHGWTGTGAMHPFVDELGRWLLRWTARNVSLCGKAGQKGSRLTDDQTKWNMAIGAAENAVAEMFAPLSQETIAEHDRYFASEYVKRVASRATPEEDDVVPPTLGSLSVAETQSLLGSDRPISIGKVPTDPIGMRTIAAVVGERLAIDRHQSPHDGPSSLSIIDVPITPGPAGMCWAEQKDPAKLHMLTNCMLRKGHKGKHQWEVDSK